MNEDGTPIRDQGVVSTPGGNSDGVNPEETGTTAEKPSRARKTRTRKSVSPDETSTKADENQDHVAEEAGTKTAKRATRKTSKKSTQDEADSLQEGTETEKPKKARRTTRKKKDEVDGTEDTGKQEGVSCLLYTSTPEEIAEECYRAWNEGASLAHIHARNDDGSSTQDPDAVSYTHLLRDP